ncbi:SH3 domain-containing protein [Streptomyces sp. ISL-94]|uniref:SH3 domain-containing protein n=1 Tax=Streptomyces sp. ISL-94 TaxID=2819190 RepID=UPI001BED2E76|nr:SH3 domain-containing protein [Streptomyces sp. ISL-94]MBT2482648.1 SH3 domain-containing protein [Streptomyces sp. ISL-94]
MLKPPRTILALAAGSLALGLVGAGAAVADDEGAAAAATPSQQTAIAADDTERSDGHWDRYALGKVVSKGPLKVRSKPTTRSQSVNHVYPNRKIEIECKTHGESVDGNSIWYRLHRSYGAGSEDKAYGNEHWVTARYVQNLSQVKYCH